MSLVNASFDDIIEPTIPTPSTAVDGFLALWCILTFCSAFFGSLVTLWASVTHHAIKLNTISVHIIKNIAIADLGFAIFVIAPITLAIITKKWVFGTTHCIITALLLQFFAFVDSNMICALSVSKLLLIVMPLKANSWSRNLYITGEGC